MKRLFLLLFLLALGWVVWIFSSGLPRRVTTIVVGDPMRVASWDEERSELTVVEIPPHTVVEAIGGYGQYELRALWELGEIENRGGAVLALSAEEALGVPVQYFLSPPTTTADGRAAFQFTSLPNVLAGSIRTNMPISTYMGLAWRFLFLRPDHINTLTLTLSRGLSQTSQPDGTTRLELDPNEADILMGSSFEDEEVRREAYSVAVYNTTSFASLGTRVARLLSHLGYLVVTVANDEPVVERCEVRAAGSLAGSVSVRLLRDVLRCDLVADDTAKRADIVLRVGTFYAKRFLPGYSP
jgi:hypothetical protein